MSQSIQPLRIQKNIPSSSANKTSAPPTQRPLAELGPMERRRNSPSYNQNTRKNLFNGDSSPFDSSPIASNSPRLYWQNRDPASPTRSNAENRNPLGDRDSSPTPAKRSSIENLKRASRVKNSNMFAREHKQEYDPASSPMIERPLATGRPLSVQPGNVYGGNGLGSFRDGENKMMPINSPLPSLAKTNGIPEDSSSPSKALSSPTKSSMSSKSRYSQAHQAFDPENSIWTEEEESAERELPPGKSLHRHAKSVTFDVAPPQVNEYEMSTPDPSSVASGSREGSYDSVNEEEDESSDRGSFVERDDSFDASLEDTEKTPVVLPEDWRFMSPAIANEDLAAHVENPFDGEKSSPVPTAQPSSIIDARLSPTRTDSVNSNGERRPLPPLPALGKPLFPRARSDSDNSLSATAERVSSLQRVSPSPPRPASISKAEIQGMGGCSMSIEDRLRLMMIDDTNERSSPIEEQQEQRERRLRRGSPLRGSDPGEGDEKIQVHQEVENDDVADLGEYKLPPRISRESILRKVKSRTINDSEDDNSFLGLSPTSDKGVYNNLDPDTPIPSLETEVIEKEVTIKQEPDLEDSEVDVYSIPDLYSQQLHAESYMNAIEKLEAFQASSAAQEDDDDESHYSIDSKESGHRDRKSDSATDDEGPPTPRALTSNQAGQDLGRKNSHRMSLPQFAALLGESDFGFGMESFMTPSPETSHEPVKPTLSSQPSWTSEVPTEKSFLEQSISRPVTPEEQLQPPRFPGQWNDLEDESKTPDSVIRHPIAQSPLPDSPSVPEPVATIKAPGGKLKTRPSVTPADVQAMAEVRRQVSNGSQAPAIPKIPERHLSRPSVVAESDEPLFESASEVASVKSLEERDTSKFSKRKSSLLPLEVSVQGSDGLGFGIESEFDRVIEAQKVAFNFPTPDMASRPWSPGHAEHMPGQEFKSFREVYANKAFRTQKGYLMRQNTKVIIASSASHESAESVTDTKDSQEPAARGTRSAGNSPRKPSHTQTWTAEPWNGKIRRKSIRKSGGIPSKSPGNGPAPPLPGQQSNVASGLGSVTEDESMQNAEEIGEDGERGRLFVKVVRVKDLDLPLPKGERSYFALTLDNGLHCVTTAWLELGKTAPIGQEFELVVLNDLEFQLTLQTKLEEPKAKPVVESPTKSTSPSKPSTFSRVFASPRKRKELEMKRQEEAQQAERQKQQASKRIVQPTAWDLLHGLVAKDGSFARSYVCLKDHETSAYGKPYTVDVPCFNEWATEEAHTMSSVKSKRSAMNGGVQRKAPYRVGKLELQLLFVPKPKDAKDEDMPKSMNACVRELKEAESATLKKWEGNLSQQGGDCPYWRRRFFTLDGPKFTAFHESTRQPRATINLAKASKLIDDKSALMRNDVPAKGKGRRKSAFAEEEEGYMFVEEGFRVRFANGETIDFYADSAAEKDGWMKVLSEVVGKDTTKPRSWTDLVLAKQRAAASRADQAKQGQGKAFSGSAKQAPSLRSAPATPAKHFSHPNVAPPAPDKSPRRSDIGSRTAERAKTRSMMF
ncbi:MAG: Bud site selection protein bud4 [Alectoria fallacina]|uniref:Bud site selection protein bud4 n=1 Tax=Alectoria fallacina TaxID=1903189 RepID=A0A8H3G0Z2_9LECA|nr:MAG: Bud site selection protein bud4 [Alectoria fallacina]